MNKLSSALRGAYTRNTALLRALLIATGVAASALVMSWTSPASAGNLSIRSMAGATCQDFIVSCANGREYAFCPRAVSQLGDVVTGTLMTSRHHGIPMRLIPMGVGYRYAGKGIWLDGYESAAALNFGKHTSVACQVTHIKSPT